MVVNDILCTQSKSPHLYGYVELPEPHVNALLCSYICCIARAPLILCVCTTTCTNIIATIVRYVKMHQCTKENYLCHRARRATDLANSNANHDHYSPPTKMYDQEHTLINLRALHSLRALYMSRNKKKL